jgi:hypothetical protein
MDLIRKGGWIVKPVYIGHTPSPKARYEMWGELLRGEHGRFRRVRFNRGNCNFLIESMRGAKLKKGTGKEDYVKNKDDERNQGLDQRTTTHHSDGIDTLLWGVCENRPVEISASGVITT